MIFLQFFLTSADAEAAIPTASCDGTSGKSLEKKAAHTKSLQDVCFKYP